MVRTSIISRPCLPRLDQNPATVRTRPEGPGIRQILCVLVDMLLGHKNGSPEVRRMRQYDTVNLDTFLEVAPDTLPQER